MASAQQEKKTRLKRETIAGTLAEKPSEKAKKNGTAPRGTMPSHSNVRSGNVDLETGEELRSGGQRNGDAHRDTIRSGAVEIVVRLNDHAVHSVRRGGPPGEAGAVLHEGGSGRRLVGAAEHE